METKRCSCCDTSFNIDSRDMDFYKKVSPQIAGRTYSMSAPTLCPECRLRRRLSFRNQIYLFQRNSSLTGERIFSAYSEDCPFPVFSRDQWWSDGWDALSFGRNYDYSQKFFCQFEQLRNVVPHIASLTAGELENCDFSNNIAHAKNCYLVFSTTFVQDCMYCEAAYHCRDCIDCSYTYSSELCYDCLASSRCYNLKGSWCCEGCRDSYFLLNCRSCTNCWGCANLSHRQYCIFNEQRTKDDYNAFVARMPIGTYSGWEEAKKEANYFWRKSPRAHLVARNAEDSTGNFIFDCRDVHDSFIIRGGESLRYCFHLHDGAKDCQDLSVGTLRTELNYECLQMLNGSFNCQFCFFCAENCSELRYCWGCVNCNDCFGCVGLRKKQYCILNKQYSKSDYQEHIGRIITQMRSTGEWGEFFPIRLAPIPYNRSLAQRYFQVTKEEAVALNLSWYDTPMVEPSSKVTVLGETLPDDDDPIIARSLSSGALYRITSEEIRRRRHLGVPLPRKSYDERLEQRALDLGPCQLFDRRCAKTGRELKTCFAPNSQWIIWDKDILEQELLC